MMKTMWTLLLVILIGSGCRKPENHVAVVWITSMTNGVYWDIAHLAISSNELDQILALLTKRNSDVGLNICMTEGISVDKAFPILRMADRYKITNIAVRVNQTRPPYIPPDIIYDAMKEKEPQQGGSTLRR